MKRPGASCGLAFSCPADIQVSIQVATEAGYDFVSFPIVHPKYRIPESFGAQNGDKCHGRQYPFARSDILLSSTEWNTLVVGVISRHLNIESRNEIIRRSSEEALHRELNFASHLGKTSKS